MKYLLGTLLFISTALSTKAQNVLKIMMEDRSEITVSIDGRDYKRVGRELTFVDIPPGWHDLRVYEFIAYRDGGGKARLVHTSRIRLKRGNATTCIVDGRSGRMMIEHKDINEQANMATPEHEPTQVHTVTQKVLTDEDLVAWEEHVAQIPTDTERLQWLQSSLKGREFTTEQMKKMVDWVAFESTGVELAKWGYNKVLDAHNYKQLVDAFSLESSKKELMQYIDPK